VILKFPSSRYTRNKERNQTGSGLFHPIVKEQIIPGQLEGLQTNPHPTEATTLCQVFFFREKIIFFAPLQNFSRRAKCLKRSPARALLNMKIEF
jgi:hypothetical protein